MYLQNKSTFILILSVLLCYSSSSYANRYTADIRSLALGGNLAAVPQYHVAKGNPATLSQLSDRTDLIIKIAGYGQGHGSNQDYDQQLLNYRSHFSDYLTTPGTAEQAALEAAAQSFHGSGYRETQHAIGAVALPHLPIALETHLLVYHQEQMRGTKTQTSDYSNISQPVTNALGSYRSLTTVEIASGLSKVVYEDKSSNHKLSFGMRVKLQNHRTRSYEFPPQYILGIPYHQNTSGKFNLDFGLLAHLQQTNYIGLMINDTFEQKLPFIQTDQYYHQRPDARLGVAKKDGNWLLMADVELIPDENLWEEKSQTLRTGIEISMSPQVQLRIGTTQDLRTNERSNITGGFGMHTSWFFVDAYVQRNQQEKSAGLGFGFKL